MFQELFDKLSGPISELELLSPLAISASDDYQLVCSKMCEKGHGVASVYDGSDHLGIILERNLLLSVFERKNAGEMARQFPFQIHPETTILDACELAIVQNSYYLPVFDDSGKVVNYLSVRIILNLIMSYFDDIRAKYGTLLKWDLENTYPYLSTFISLDESEAAQLTPEALELPIIRISATPVSVVDSSCTTEEILKEMISSQTGIVVLTNFGTMIDGIVTERDYLLKMSSYSVSELVDLDMRKFMTQYPDLLMARFRVIYAINNIMKRGYRNVLLVNEDRIPVSTISVVDILRFIIENLLPTK